MPERQAALVPSRRFRFDLCWPAVRLAVEVQGGIFLPKGAHTSGKGVTRDCEKAALAMIEGWRVLPVTGGQVRSGLALKWIERLLLRSSGPFG